MPYRGGGHTTASAVAALGGESNYVNEPRRRRPPSVRSRPVTPSTQPAWHLHPSTLRFIAPLPACRYLHLPPTPRKGCPAATPRQLPETGGLGAPRAGTARGDHRVAPAWSCFKFVFGGAPSAWLHLSQSLHLFPPRENRNRRTHRAATGLDGPTVGSDIRCLGA